MICIERKSGDPVFVDSYQIDEQGNVRGQRVSKEGRKGTVVIPAGNVSAINDWADDVKV